MLFTTLAIGTPIVAFLSLLFTVGNQLRKKVDPQNIDLEDAWKRVGYTFLWGWLAGGVLFFFVALSFSSADGNPQVEVENTTYPLAPNSKFDVGRTQFTFIAVDEHGVQEPVKLTYSDLNIENQKPSTVHIKRDDQFHPWIAPWPLSTKTYVTVK